MFIDKKKRMILPEQSTIARSMDAVTMKKKTKGSINGTSLCHDEEGSFKEFWEGRPVC